MLFCHDASRLCFFTFQDWMTWEFLFHPPSHPPKHLQCFIPFVFVKGNTANRKTCQYEEDHPFLGVTSMGLPCRVCQFTNRPQVTLDGPTPKSPWLFNAIWLLRSLGQLWGAHPASTGSCHAVTAAPSSTPLTYLQLGGGWQDPPLPISPAWAKLCCFLSCF